MANRDEQRPRRRWVRWIRRAGAALLATAAGYFVAHEVAHAMTADRVGRRRYFSLAAFQQEGYADYVAFARPVNLARSREALVPICSTAAG